MKKRNHKRGSRKSNLRKISLRLARPVHALLLAAAMFFPPAAAHADDLYWTGSASNNWNLADVNWLGGVPIASPTAFADGDSAWFDTINSTITLDDGSRTVALMFVTDSNLAFVGNILTSAGGALVADNSQLTLNGDNQFAGGIHLFYSTLTLAHDRALGDFVQDATKIVDSQGQVVVVGGNVVKITEDRGISNRFVLASNDPTDPDDPDDSTLTFDIASGKTLTISGVEVAGYSGGAISNTYSGQRIFVSDKGKLVFDGNRSVSVTEGPNTYGGNGGAIYNASPSAATLDLSGLESLHFLNNEASRYGGGIYNYALDEDSTLTLGDRVVFTGNTAGMFGGALSAVSLRGNSSFTIGDYAEFSGNSSNLYGGAIHVASNSNLKNTEVKIGVGAKFLNNTAGSFGGAILFGGVGPATLNVGRNAEFQNNTTNGWGGAIYTESDNSQIILKNNTWFGENAAKSTDINGGGGAIFASQDLTILGETLFGYNVSGANGGAIFMAGYSAGTLLLDTNIYNGTTRPGQIVFAGNRSSYDFDAEGSGNANAIHLSQDTTLSVIGIGNVFFNDPISTGTGGGNRYEQDNGMVQFMGHSVLNPSDKTGGGVDITGGIFRVVTGASFTTGGSGGEKFRVESATLAGGGTIHSPNGFDLSGATIAPDADTLSVSGFDYGSLTFTGVTTIIDPTKKIGTLALNGDVLLSDATLAVDLSGTSSSDKIVVSGKVFLGDDINAVDITTWDLGTYTILEATSITAVDDIAITDINDYFTDVIISDLSAMGGNLSAWLELNGNQLILHTSNAEGNHILTWTGADIENGDLWNTAASNWKSGLETPLYNAGDCVIFNSTDMLGNREITVQTIIDRDYGVQVGSMEVSGDGNYTFSGGGILVTKQGSTLTGTATGKLVKSGTGTLTLDNANRFVHGVTLAGGTIVLGDNEALGTYAANTTPSDSEGQVTVTANAMVGINDDLTLSNRFVVNTSQKLTIDTDDYALTIQNVAGGAFQLASSATLELGDNLTLTNAAINASTGSTVTFGTNTLIQNTVGDAVVSAGTVNVYGESSFNVTGGNAVNITGGSLNLNTAAGDITFTAGDISLSGSSVNVSGDKTVYFDTDLAGSAGSSYTQTGGTAQFTGTNVLNTGATGGGEVSVSGSDTVFRVVEGATFATAGTDNKQFNVTGGATLSGGGTITSANGFHFNDATISAHSALNSIGTLTLVGDVSLASTTLAVDLGSGNVGDTISVVNGDVTFGDFLNLVDILTWTEGEYVIMKTLTDTFTIEDLTGDINDMFANILVNGDQLGVNQNAYLELRDDTTLVLVTENLGDSVVLTWTGNDSATWNTGDENWKTGTNPTATFSIGDYVIFDSVSDIAGNRDITIAGVFAQVAGMTVTGDEDYTFSGGGIKALTDTTDYDGADLGKLVKSGAGRLTLNNENEFIYGVTLAGGTIVLGDSKALGTFVADTTTPGNSTGQVTVTGDAAVGINDNLIISNRFVVADNTTLAVNTGTDAILTIQSVNNGTATGGAFALGVGSTLNLGDRVILTGNTASSGSAVFGDEDSVINFGTNTWIHGNTGDAVVSASNVYVYGNTQFDANTGYAVNIANGTLAIDTTAGHVAFTDSTEGSVNLTGATLEITGGNNVYFDDAISGTTATITQEGGQVQLRGDSAFSDAAAVTLSDDGTLRVVSGASLDLGTGTFTADSGTLAGGGSITAASFSFDGVIISPDAAVFATPEYDADTLAFGTASITIADTDKIATLALAGDVALNNTTLAINLGTGVSDKIEITGAAAFTGTNRVDYGTVTELGKWDILTATDGITGVNFEAITGSFGGYSLTRGSSVHLKDGSTTVLELVLDNSKNITLTWTNAATTGVWSVDDRNWTDGGEETRFLTGDTVIFDATGGGGTVYVDDDGVAAASVTVAGGVNYTFTGGGITTTGALIKNDAGILTLTSANDFGGGTLLNGGRINVGNAAALGSQLITMAAGTTLGFNDGYAIENNIELAGNATIDTGANSVTITGVLSDDGGLTKTGSGTLTLSGTNTYGGGTTLSAGRMNVGSDAALGAGTVSMAAGTTLGFTGDFGVSNAIYLTGDATIDSGANATTVSGIISGDGGFTKAGEGSLALSGDNEFDGDLDVSEGEVRVGHANALGGGGVNMAADTTLAFDGSYIIGNVITLDGTGISIDTNGNDTTFSSGLTGTGGFAKNGDGTLTLAALNTHGGATDINAGTLVLSAADALAASSAVTVSNTAILSAADDQAFKQLNVGSNATLAMNDHALTIESGLLEGTLTGISDLVKTTAGELEIATTASITDDLTLGAGTLTLSGENTLTVGGKTTISAGTTLGLDALQDGGMLFTDSMFIAAGATLEIKSYSGTEPKILVTSNEEITGFFSTIIVNGEEYIDGQITPIDLEHFISGMVVQLAEDKLTIEISGGGYVWNNTGTNSAHGVFLVNDTWELDANLANNTNSDAWFDGGEGYGKWDGKTLVKRGTGTLVLTGTNTFDGPANVEGGTLAITHAGALTNTEGVNLSDGTVFELAYDADGSFGKTVSGTGSLLKTGDATVTLTDVMGHSGATNINGGTLGLSVADTLTTSSAVNVADDATLTAAKSQTFRELNVAGDGAVTMTGTGDDANLTLDSGTITGTLDGVNDLTKTTGGELEIDTTATITGDLNLDEGQLTLGSDKTLTVGGTTTIEDGATLSVGGTLAGGTLHSDAMTIGEDTTLVIRNYAGSGTVTLITSGEAIVGDFTNILINGNPYEPGDLTVSLEKFINDLIVQKTLDLTAIEISNGGLVWNNTGVKNAHGVFYVADGSSVLSENLVNNGVTAAYYTDDATDYAWDGKTLDKTGEGRLLLTGNNTFTGAANVKGGTLAISHEGALAETTGVNLSDGTAFELAYDADGSFGKVVSGTGGLLKTGGATVGLTAAQAYTGATEVKAGTLALAGSGDISTSSGLNLAAGTAFDISGISAEQTRVQNLTGSGGVALGGKTLELAAGDYEGVIDGTGGILKSSNGTLVLRDVNTYTGTTSVTGGVLQLAVENAIAASDKVLLTAGAILADADQTFLHLETSAGTTVDMDDNALTVGAGTLNGTMQNVSTFTKDTGGELNLTGANYLQNVTTVELKDGKTVAAAAQTFKHLLLASDAELDMTGKALTVASGTLSGTLTSLGVFTKTGGDTLTLDGADMLSSASHVYLNGGTLATTGAQTLKNLTLGSGTTFDADGDTVTIAASGQLTGSGTIKGNVNLSANTRISTGTTNATNTLAVDGNLNFATSSTYQVEVNPDGYNSDVLAVSGTANLNGASVVHVGFDGTSRDYPAEGTWTILTANEIVGSFSGVVSNFAFLDAELYHYAKSVELELKRNSINFEDHAHTGNQHAVADGLSSLDSGNELYNQMMQLGRDQDIGGIYDELSGEIHASVAGAMLDADRAFGRTLRQRIWLSNLVRPGYPLWFSADGFSSQADGGWNAAKAKHSGFGINIGAEKVNENWMAGIVFRYADSDLKVNDRVSSSGIDSYTLGFYGAGQIGFFQLSAGGTVGWHSIDSTRQVTNATLSQRLVGDYDAQTGQVFAEIAFKCYGHGNASLMPYFGFSWNSVRTDAFTERGGPAALAVAKTTNDNVNTTLGVRASYLMFGRFALEGDLYWLHNYGDVDPTTDVAFTGGRDFTVFGSAFSRDAAGLTLSGNFIITQRFNVRASYNGLFSADTSAHAGSLTAEVKF